jgi:hypothetical protein
MKITSRITPALAATGLLTIAFVAPASASSTPRDESTSASYTCSATTPKGTFSYSGSVTFAGTTPSTVAVGATVPVTGFQAHLSVPGSVVDEVASYGVRSISASVTAFDITATDAATASVDVVKKAVNVGHTTLSASGNAAIEVSVPRRPAKVGGWVASSTGTMDFAPGSATLHFKTNLGSLNVGCTPGSPVSPISTTTVS